jgi:polyphosphate glucokinase
MGKKEWRRYVARIVEELLTALNADYVVLGGGNVKKIKKLPPKTRLGANGNAFIGGYRLWSEKKGSRVDKGRQAGDPASRRDYS